MKIRPGHMRFNLAEPRPLYDTVKALVGHARMLRKYEHNQQAARLYELAIDFSEDDGNSEYAGRIRDELRRMLSETPQNAHASG